MKRSLITVWAVIIITVGSGVANAGFIVDANLPANVISFDHGINAVNNDNTSASLPDLLSNNPVEFNWIGLIKTYETTAPIDIPFTVINSQGTTEYFFAEGLLNFTGQSWSDYHLELGIGTGDQFVSLSQLGAQDRGLDFDTPDADPTPYSFFIAGDHLEQIFANVSQGPDAITFDGGTIPVSNIGNDLQFDDFAWITFSLDVPDSENERVYQFTLRQHPSVVPEPISLMLLSSGLIGGVVLRKKRTV